MIENLFNTPDTIRLCRELFPKKHLIAMIT